MPVESLLEREPVLAELDRLRRLASRGAGRVVLLSGEAGVGKNAVIGRFVAGLDGPVRVLRGWCDPLATPRPLGLLIDMLDGLRRPEAAGVAAAINAGGGEAIYARLLGLFGDGNTDTYVIPRIGAEHLQRLDGPQLLRLYRKLLAEGRVKRDRNTEMYVYWSGRAIKGEQPTPCEVSEACETTIHAARAAVRRFRSGVIPKQIPPGLAPKTVRNIHAMIHRALVDAVAWKYINANPASTIRPPKLARARRKVWMPDQIRTFLKSVQQDRFAPLFLLELTTGIRRGQLCGLRKTPARRSADLLGANETTWAFRSTDRVWGIGKAQVTALKQLDG